jgi:hypothetical protein
MRFHEPFDDVQYDAAVKMHAQMRTNLAELRRHYGPRSPEEERLLRRYRESIQNFGRELLKPYGKINAERLNEQDRQAAKAFVAYLQSYGLRG